MGRATLLDAIVARLPGAGPARVGAEAIRVAILAVRTSASRAVERDPRRGAGDRLGCPGTDSGHDRHRARRGDTPSSSSTRPRAAPQASGSGRGSSTTRSCGARRRRPRDVALAARRLDRGLSTRISRRRRPRKASCSTIVVLSSDSGSQGRGCAAEDRAAPAPAAGIVTVSAKTGRGRRTPARPCRAALREAHESHPHTGAEPVPRRVAGGTPGSRPGRRRLNLLYGTQTQSRPPRLSASSSTTRGWSRRLRLLGQKQLPSTLSSSRGSRLDRFRSPL